MLSRAAQGVYWMHRYRERAENTARLLEVNLHLAADAPQEIGNQWESLVKTTGGEELFRAQNRKPTMKDVVQFLAFELENPNSIRSCLARSRENARVIRDTINSEIWQEINTVYLFSQKASSGPKGSLDGVFSRIKRQCQLITGMADTTMSHNEAWYFGRIGGLLERADMCTRFVDAKCFMLLPQAVKADSPFDNIQWTALLKSASAFEMYRKHRRQIQSAPVVGFLLLDREFPRSVYSCLSRIADSLKVLDGGAEPSVDGPAAAVAGTLEWLGAMTGASIVERGLHDFLDRLQLDFAGLHQRLHDRYFAGVPAS